MTSTWSRRFEAGARRAWRRPLLAEVASEDEPALETADVARAGAELVAFRVADGPDEAREAGAEAVTRLLGAGVDSADIEETLKELVQSTPDKPWRAAVADSILASAGALLRSAE